MATLAITGPIVRIDATYGGAYRVRGTVTVQGVPAQRRVVLFNTATALEPFKAIRAVWSATDGIYSIDRIANGEYIVIAFDYARDRNAAIADFVAPEPMP